MGYQLLAELVMLLHFGFLAYIALGGFLAWWRPWLIVPHVGAAVWGALSATVGIPCPLTVWEHEARRLGGEQGLTRGFIDTYLNGVIYPQEHLRTAQLLVAAHVLVAWTGFVLRSRRSVIAPAKGRRRSAVADSGGARADR
jgi:hypothetical protein